MNAPTHTELLRRATEVGYEITPTLNAELLMLSVVSDVRITAAYNRIVVKQIAHEFQVPFAVAEMRIGDSIPAMKAHGEAD
jgi:uncharacterized membrane protein